jgi:hypothetical protein
VKLAMRLGNLRLPDEAPVGSRTTGLVASFTLQLKTERVATFAAKEQIKALSASISDVTMQLDSEVENGRVLAGKLQTLAKERDDTNRMLQERDQEIESLKA